MCTIEWYVRGSSFIQCFDGVTIFETGELNNQNEASGVFLEHTCAMVDEKREYLHKYMNEFYEGENDSKTKYVTSAASAVHFIVSVLQMLPRVPTLVLSITIMHWTTICFLCFEIVIYGDDEPKNWIGGLGVVKMLIGHFVVGGKAAFQWLHGVQRMLLYSLYRIMRLQDFSSYCGVGNCLELVLPVVYIMWWL